jgi:hypothetical protein
MAAGFETSDAHASPALRPIRVAVRPDQVFAEACEQVDDLRGWERVSVDEAARTIVCRKRGGLLSGTATVTIRCEGAHDLPSTTVTVTCASEGGLFSQDRAVALQFLAPFRRRVG